MKYSCIVKNGDFFFFYYIFLAFGFCLVLFLDSCYRSIACSVRNQTYCYFLIYPKVCVKEASPKFFQRRCHANDKQIAEAKVSNPAARFPFGRCPRSTSTRSHWGRNSEPRFRQARRFRRSGQGGCRSGVLRWPYATLSPCREKVYDPSDVRNKCFPHSFSSGSLVKATCSQNQ